MAQVEQERVEFRTNVSGQYTFAVKSFSDLSEILSGGAESYESPEFGFGGQKWKLSLYPNGDTGCGGGGHISLYLNMVDATGSYGSGIGVTCKMLVWDQIRDEFLAVQGSLASLWRDIFYHVAFSKMSTQESLVRSYGDSRTEEAVGIHSANVLGHLQGLRSQSGYLVDDCCLFGIELMIVVSPDVRLGCLSIVKKPADGTFKWTLDKFSTLKEYYHDTDPFTVEVQQWLFVV